MGRAPELTSFVGRQRELSDLAHLLDASRLVTLAGPGGVGKTRLATHILRDRDDVHVLDLAPITDPSLVAATLAEQLGLPSSMALDDALDQSTMLLLLDNCEHVLDACADLASRLLSHSRQMRILATTREPLHVVGETVLRLNPLDVPGDDSLGQLQHSEAGQLFAQRAQSARSDFRLTQANAESVARICRRLDGLPLAIELAANRVAAFAPVDIANRLDGLLATPTPGVPERQQTLETTIAWSYNLLEPDDQTLFNGLSVFLGGFTLGAAEAMCPPSADALAIVSRLVTRSLVLAEPQPNATLRYRLLEPLRAFGLANLRTTRTLASARQRHAEFILELAERAHPELYGPRQPEFFQQLDADWDNIRQADDWLYESADAERALRLGAALAWWWSRPDRQAEAYSRLTRSLTLADADAYPRLRGLVVGGAATAALLQSDMPAAERYIEEALGVGRAEHDTHLECVSLSLLGLLRLYQGDLDAAEAVLQEGLRRTRETHERWVETRVLNFLADVALTHGDAELAEERLRASLRLAREGRYVWNQGMALTGLGDLLRSRGDARGAGEAYEEALAMYRQITSGGLGTHGLLHNLGYVAAELGQLGRAAELFVDSADQYGRVGTDRRGLAECLIGLATVAVRADKPELAARLLASVDAALAELGSTVTASNRAAHHAVIDAVTSALDPARLAAAQTAGRRLTLAEALDQARDVVRPIETPLFSAGLTQREVEVARLVAHGLSNRQVADTLVISEKTAKNHVQRVLDKMGVRSRSQLAARRDEFGLGD